MTVSINTFGGRKFLLALFSTALTAWLTYVGRLDANTYLLVTGTVVGAFIGGNVVQAVKRKLP